MCCVCFFLLKSGSFCIFCSRLDELRHRLIPLYSYDPTEEQEDDEEDDLAVSKTYKFTQNIKLSSVLYHIHRMVMN